MFTKLRKPKPLKNYSNTEVSFNPCRDELAPKTPCRILITGATGCGKTNLLFNLIFDYLCWDRLYINCRDPSESKYTLLHNILSKVQQKEKSEDFYWFNSTSEGVVDVDDIDKRFKNVIVFDDFVSERAAIDKINALFLRGRKKNATIIYLSQSYFATPKIVRLQCNYQMFFAIKDDREVRNIFQTNSMGLNKDTFLKVFRDATSEPYSFLMLDLHTDEENLRIRKNLDYGYKPS